MIPGLGTVLNTATILAGGGLGIAAGDRIPERVRHTVVQALGLFTVALGVRTALLPAVGHGPAPDLAIVLLSLLLGGVIGSVLDIDGRLSRFGDAVQRRLTRGAPTEAGGTLAVAFVTTSLLFCVGPLTILGSFDDGARGDLLLLGIKSTLDGFAALAFTVSLGRGVLLSAVTVVVVQGSLTALAFVTRGALDTYLVTQALGAGGVILLGIGVVLLELRRLRMPDLLPALAVAPLLAALVRRFGLPL
ncbi:MAG: DUF554 domain-containing protein [Candidatus Dormibacteria bacterium]